MTNIQQIRALLAKNNYEIVVEGKYNGCVIKMPNNKYTSFRIPSIREYQIKRKPSAGLIIKDTIEYEESKRFIDLPVYGAKPFIFIDLIRWCRDIGYSFDCVRFLSRDGIELDILTDYLPVVKSMSKNIDKLKEYSLFNLLLEVEKNGNSERLITTAQQKNVYDAYIVFHKIYTGEIIT